eukprot:93568_1
MGFDEGISLKAATMHPNNINKAVTYIENQSNNSFDDNKEFEVPIFFKIPNHANGNDEYEEHEHSFHVSSDLYEEVTVHDLLQASIAILNQKVNVPQGVEYKIMNPNDDLISKSFCDITSQEQQLRHLTEFNKHDVISKGLHLYCNKVGGNPEKEKHSSSTSIDEKIAVLMALGYEEYIAQAVLEVAENDLATAIKTLSGAESIPNTSPHNDAKSHDGRLIVPIYIKIPNRGNGDDKWESQDTTFPISNELYPKVKVIDVLHASVQELNQKLNAAQGDEYQIMNPDDDMIAKSFCDVTSHDEQLKYLSEFSKHDVITKGLHLYCNNKDEKSSTTSIDDKIEILMAMGYEIRIAKTVLAACANDLVEAIKILSEIQDQDNDSKSQDESDGTLEVPIYFQIPNRSNSNDEYESADTSFPISSELYPKVRVTDVLIASIYKLNQKMGAEYQIVDPDEDMISKSFCDLSSQGDQFKYLTQFDKNDVITKGLHLRCAVAAEATSGNDFHQSFEKISKSVLAHASQTVYECENDITKCKSIEALSNRFRSKTVDDMDCGQILNEFHHILMCHDINDEQFDHVVNQCDGPCELANCHTVRRYYGDRSTSGNDPRKRFVHELFDRMHSHIRHGYDMFRLTTDERKRIEQFTRTDDDEKENDMNIAAHLKSISTILKRKKSRFNSLIPTNRFMRDTNKFSSNMGQIATQQPIEADLEDAKQENTESVQHSHATYSFSYNFNYWSQCKHSTQRLYWGYIKDLYVAPKHDSLKDEVLNNKISRIDLEVWTKTCQEADEQMKSSQCKHTKATFHGTGRGSNHWMDSHPSNFGYQEGDCLQRKHLITVMIYCGEDKFQKKYSETYRALSKNDTFEIIKERHSNFHHFAKALKEVVEVFGTFYVRSTPEISRFYHGINTEMVFYGTASNIYTVLSTSISYITSQIFAQNNGMIVEMVPSGVLKYFDCRWLSKYPAEQEFLFIGGRETMYFINIIQTAHDIQLKKYITALRVIDVMFNGYYFNKDPTIAIKIGQDVNCLELSKLGHYPDVSPEVKRIVCKLFEHEAHKYQPNTYTRYNDLHPYIDDLLHNMCLNKIRLSINVKAMKSGLLSKFDLDGGGYIGYSFAKDYICSTHHESVDMSFLNMILPSISTVYIEELSSMHSLLLDGIFDFLSGNKITRIDCIELRLEHALGFGNILEQYAAYESKFESIGFGLNVSEDPGTRAKRLVIGTYMSED